jgi:hypothetical protein
VYLTSVIVVLDQHFNSQDCLLDAIEKSGCKCELLVYNNSCQDNEVKEALKKASTHFIDTDSIIEASYSECVNSLLSISQGDHICIMHSFGYLEQDWMLKLREANDRVFNSGIVYINEVDHVEYSDYALNNQEELESIQNNDNKVQNILFFKKQFLSIIGGLHPNLCSTSAISHFARRFYFSGFTNFAVPGNSMLRLHTYVDTLQSTQLEYKQSLDHLTKSKNFFVPLFQQTEKHFNLINDLSAFGEALFSLKLGAGILTSQKLSTPDLIQLTTIADNNSASIELLPASYYDNNVLKNRILLLFR